MIKSLQTLRAIGAIMIFVHHFGFDNRIVASFGDCAVNWFMMLSGFVLCAAHETRLAPLYRSAEQTPTPGAVGSFMLKRIRHIAPMYLVGLLLMVVIGRAQFSGPSFVASLLMVQSWIPRAEFYFSYNSPAWFISDVMFCYLLFLPLLWYISRRGAGRLLWIVTVLYAAALLLVPAGSEQAFYLFYIFPVLQLPSFILGMVCWQAVIRLRGRYISPLRANMLIIGTLVLVGVSMGCYGWLPERFSLSSYWWPSTLLVLIIFTMTDPVDCFMIRLLHRRPLIWLGNVSMVFYMLHLPWIRGSRIVLAHLGLSVPAFVELPLSILLLALLSGFLSRLTGLPKTNTRKRGRATER